MLAVSGTALVAAAVVALLRFQREFALAWRLEHEWVQSIQTFMASNWLAFGFGQMLVAASGVLPASMIALMAGATMGFGWGLAVSATSTLLGGWLAFLLSRSALRRWIATYVQRHPAMAQLDKAMTAEGWRLVLLLRVSPVMPFALTSYGLGLTRISQRDFLLGTLASLPALTAYVALGALGKQGLQLAGSGASAGHWLSLAGGVGVVCYALLRVRKTLARVGTA